MGRWLSARVAPAPHSSAASGGLARAGMSWVAALATGAAVVVAAALTLVFAATLAVAALLASVLFALYAVALKSRRNVRRPVVLEARKVGHSWVAYGWDRRAR